MCRSSPSKRLRTDNGNGNQPVGSWRGDSYDLVHGSTTPKISVMAAGVVSRLVTMNSK